MPPSPSDPRPRRRIAGHAAGVLAAAGLAACTGGEAGSAVDGDASRAAGTGTSAAPGEWRGVPVDSPLTLPDLTLTDTRGRSYRLRRETRDGVTLLFLGYTHCPDVCPVQMANLGAVLDDLAPSLRRHLRVVFVSVDPARDSAARIRSWLDRFGDGFVGLRGSEDEIGALQDALRLPRAARQERRVQGRYTMGHAAQVLAFGPGGRAWLAYPSGTRQRDWSHDLPRLARKAAGGGRGERAATGREAPDAHPPGPTTAP